MERIETQLHFLNGGKVNDKFLIYDKLDKIPVFDHLYLTVDRELNKQMHDKGKSNKYDTLEKVLFTCWVSLVTSYFSLLYKKRKLVVTSEQLFLLKNKNDFEVD